MTDIKSCPFCGEDAFLYGNDEDPTNAVSTEWNVECCLCGLRTGYHEDAQNAVKAWNKRINPV